MITDDVLMGVGWVIGSVIDFFLPIVTPGGMTVPDVSAILPWVAMFGLVVPIGTLIQVGAVLMFLEAAATVWAALNWIYNKLPLLGHAFL